MMKMTIFLLGFSLGVLFRCPEVHAGVQFPESKPTQTQRTSLKYQIFRILFADIDKSLKKAEMTPEICTFSNNRTRSVQSFQGLAPCLFENFRESLVVYSPAGVVHVWLKNKKGQSLQMAVEWRPTTEGWWAFFQEASDLKFERISRWLQKNRKTNQPPQSVEYQKNFLGKIRLSFPEEARSEEFFNVDFFRTAFQSQGHLDTVEFEMNPIGRVDGYVNYRGQIAVRRVSVEKNYNTITVSFETDLNLFRTEREFDFKSHLKSESGSTITESFAP